MRTIVLFLLALMVTVAHAADTRDPFVLMDEVKAARSVCTDLPENLKLECDTDFGKLAVDAYFVKEGGSVVEGYTNAARVRKRLNELKKKYSK